MIWKGFVLVQRLRFISGKVNVSNLNNKKITGLLYARNLFCLSYTDLEYVAYLLE